MIEKAAVEKIMAKRMNPRKRENEYLVKWESKPQTWEPANHLESCKDLIENFEILLAKQKEMRLKSQQQQNTPVSQPAATSTPTAATPSTPGRPVRFSKEKAINQVKQWTGGNKHHDDSTEASSGKRKLEEDDDFEDEMDGDDVDDEDYELESSWEKKKMAHQLGQTSVKRIKTEPLGQNGGVRVFSKSGSDMQIGATVVRKVVGAKSPDVIMAGQKQQSGVFKKASPAAIVQKKTGEGQVRIVGSKDQIQSGIVRVGAAGANKPGLVTRVVPKASPTTQVRSSPTGTVVRTVQSVQNQQKALAQKIIQRSPINKAISPNNRSTAQVVQRVQTRSPAASLARKPGLPQQQTMVTRRPGQAQYPANQQSGRVVKKGTAAQDDDDDGIPDPFPKDLPPIETESSSPPPPLTLCPITGKVLGQAEGESTAEEQEADGENANQHQITQLLSNEDGTPIYITGDDGTMYQVAGKNANGETILISTNDEGEQTCVLLPADQDLLAGLPGIQTTDASEAQMEAPADGSAAGTEEAVNIGEQQEGEQFFAKESDETSQSGGEEATQPLSIAVGAESGDSQDGQITAEIVQADEPSPGEIKRFH